MVRKIVLLMVWGVLLATHCFAGIVINDGLSREHNIRPGEKVDGKITLRNTTDTPQNVKVYQTDYRHSAKGAVAYGEPGSLTRSNAAWISISPLRLNIPPKEAVSVYYAIQVPDESDLKGTYWSMVMVEPFSRKRPRNESQEPVRDSNHRSLWHPDGDRYRGNGLPADQVFG